MAATTDILTMAETLAGESILASAVLRSSDVLGTSSATDEVSLSFILLWAICDWIIRPFSKNHSEQQFPGHADDLFVACTETRLIVFAMKTSAFSRSVDKILAESALGKSTRLRRSKNNRRVVFLSMPGRDTSQLDSLDSSANIDALINCVDRSKTAG